MIVLAYIALFVAIVCAILTFFTKKIVNKIFTHADEKNIESKIIIFKSIFLVVACICCILTVLYI